MKLEKLNRIINAYDSTSKVIKQYAMALFTACGLVFTYGEKIWPEATNSVLASKFAENQSQFTFWATSAIISLLSCLFVQYLMKLDFEALWKEVDDKDGEVPDSTVKSRLSKISYESNLETLFFIVACGFALGATLILFANFSSIKVAVGIPMLIAAAVVALLIIRAIYKQIPKVYRQCKIYFKK